MHLTNRIFLTNTAYPVLVYLIDVGEWRVKQVRERKCWGAGCEAEVPGEGDGERATWAQPGTGTHIYFLYLGFQIRRRLAFFASLLLTFGMNCPCFEVCLL